MNKEELKKLFNVYCKDQVFMLNPDKEIVNRLFYGILNNEKQFGLKYCPCRLTEEDFEKDLELVCPCNFFSHNT